MIEIGRILKKEREKQKLSIEDVAARTKIPRNNLIAIEKGDRNALPAKVFTVGLVKSYARELKVDADKINQLLIEEFKEPVPEAPAEPVHPTKQKQSDDDERQPVGRFQVPKVAMVAAGVVLCLLLAFAIFLLVEKMNSYDQEKVLPPEVFAENEESSEDSAEVELKDSADTQPEKEENSQPPEKPLVKKTETKEPAPSSKKSPKPIEKPVVETPSIVAPSVPAPKKDFEDDQFTSTYKKKEQPETVVHSDNKLTITAQEPVRVEILWDDGFVQVMLLKSQESKTLVFSSPIKVRVNNGGAVKMTFNEKNQGVPGPFNQPIELSYP